MSFIKKQHLFPLLLVFVYSCSRNTYKAIPRYENFTPGIPDYADLNMWAAHPDKWDPADSIPKPLKNYWHQNQVDVFFIHPTSFTDVSRVSEANAPIDDPVINQKTDYSSIMYQASIFNADAKVWAPRYRQAHIKMYWNADTAKATRAFDTAYNDVKRAFQYFITHNEGRPFIIASHSQGTTHAKRLIKDYIDTTTIKNRMIVAYLLGIPVAADEFQNIPLCKDSLTTGCFVSWRTYRRGVSSSGYSNDSWAAVVNPLTWTTDSTRASKSLHKGAILYQFNKKVKSPNDAQIHGNLLWISRPRFFGGFMYKTKNYHPGDYNLFYLNVQQDVRRRIGLFWK
jgi:hypothetical protein